MQIGCHGVSFQALFKVEVAADVLVVDRHELSERRSDWQEGLLCRRNYHRVRLKVQGVGSGRHLQDIDLDQSAAQGVQLTGNLVDFDSLGPGPAETDAGEIRFIVNQQDCAWRLARGWCGR